jgi:hypothetical protein
MMSTKEQRNQGEGISKRRQRKRAFARRKSLQNDGKKSELEFNWRSRMGQEEPVQNIKSKTPTNTSRSLRPKIDNKPNKPRTDNKPLRTDNKPLRTDNKPKTEKPKADNKPRSPKNEKRGSKIDSKPVDGRPVEINKPIDGKPQIDGKPKSNANINQQSEVKPSPRRRRRRRGSKNKLNKGDAENKSVVPDNLRFRRMRARRSSDPGPQVSRAPDSKPWRRASLPTIDWKVALLEAIRESQDKEVHVPESVLRQIYANRG